MSVVIERGLARCPRCVAVADYTFVESGRNSVRYEVHCAKCGEAYCEVNTPVAPDFTATSRALALPAPDVTAMTTGTHRRQLRAAIERARGRVLAASAAAVAAFGRRDWRSGFRRPPAEPQTPVVHH